MDRTMSFRSGVTGFGRSKMGKDWPHFLRKNGAHIVAINAGTPEQLWWLNQPIWKILLVKLDHLPRDRGLNEYLKPTPSIILMMFEKLAGVSWHWKCLIVDIYKASNVVKHECCDKMRSDSPSKKREGLRTQRPSRPGDGHAAQEFVSVRLKLVKAGFQDVQILSCRNKASILKPAFHLSVIAN